MAKLENVILQILAEKTGINFLENTGTSVSQTTEDTSNALSFAVVLSNLNNSLNKTSVENIAESSGYTYPLGSNNSYTGSSYISISTLIQKIKDNKLQDVDSVIRSYLLANYGGSVDAVIKNLAGVQALPSQISRSMQENIFNQIVAKLSIQVRQRLYNSGDSALTTDTSGETDSSVDETSFSGILTDLG